MERWRLEPRTSASIELEGFAQLLLRQRCHDVLHLPVAIQTSNWQRLQRQLCCYSTSKRLLKRSEILLCGQRGLPSACDVQFAASRCVASEMSLLN